ncbi:MAG: hypothetical protein GY851_20765, partial [bacterium]|nr:hypothetical protein [bacterium]
MYDRRFGFHPILRFLALFTVLTFFPTAAGAGNLVLAAAKGEQVAKRNVAPDEKVHFHAPGRAVE